MLRYILLVAGFLSTTHIVFSSCECWPAEQTDDWTDENAVVLICSNLVDSAVILYDSRKIMFFDGYERAQEGALVVWEYRIGESDTHAYWTFWNKLRAAFGNDEAHFSQLLEGIASQESIRFRLRGNPESPHTGRVNILRDCRNASESVEIFTPLIVSEEQSE